MDYYFEIGRRFSTRGSNNLEHFVDIAKKIFISNNMNQTAKGLDYYCRRGIVHGDLIIMGVVKNSSKEKVESICNKIVFNFKGDYRKNTAAWIEAIYEINEDDNK